MTALYADPTDIHLTRRGSSLDRAHLEFSSLVETDNGWIVRAHVLATLHEDERGPLPRITLVTAQEWIEQHGETAVAYGQRLSLTSRQIRELEDAALRAVEMERWDPVSYGDGSRQ